MEVEIYSKGPLCCSVCAPADMAREDVEAEVNSMHPCGTEIGWTISDDPTFKTGEENGGIFECHRGTTRHWLLDA